VKRILSFVNTTNINNISSDSGYVFQSLLAKELLNLEYEFIFVGPAPLEVAGVSNIPFDFGDNKYQVRFSFDWEKVQKIIEDTNPDYIFLHQAELTSNFRALLTQMGMQAKVLVYCHYIPYTFESGTVGLDVSLNINDLGESIILRFLNGISNSDIAFVHSNYAETLIKQGMGHYNINTESITFIVLPPPKDTFMEQVRVEFDSNNHDVAYNHRLYEQYGTQYFIDFIKYSNNNKCVLNYKVFDILSNRNENRKKLETSTGYFRDELNLIQNVETTTEGSNRQRYRKLLSLCKIAVAPLRIGVTWSMAIVDCMSMGIPVVAPSAWWFKDFIPLSLQYDTIEKQLDIMKKLDADSDFWSQSSIECIHRVENLTPQEIAKKFNSTVSNLESVHHEN